MSQAREHAIGGASNLPNNAPLQTTHHDIEAQFPMSPVPLSENKPRPNSPTESLLRRPMRSNTAKIYRPDQRGQDWRPGQEPGIDTSAPHGGHPQSTAAELHEQCDITVVDFSQEDMRMQYLDNRALDAFLNIPRPDWVDCRWISVNGLSWDVIKLLGNYKNLHRLAIEDLMNSRNRTKADWYSDHTYIVLPLQKLIHSQLDQNGDSLSSNWDDNTWPDDPPRKPKKRLKTQKSWKRPIWSSLRRKSSNPYHHRSPKPFDSSAAMHDPKNGFVQMGPDMKNRTRKVQTLQRYHGGPNEERILFMEKHSALASKSLGVGVEQVSIFLTSDNTVISFFESSAEDIEFPIITRLNTQETILRRSSDASMITQAIIDAIIDLAMPVAAAYQDAVGELELNVLTKADVSNTTSLYVLTSEITQFKSNISPIFNLVKALREHRNEPIGASGLNGKTGKLSSSSVTISPMTQVYLGDVEDHCIVITDGLDQMRRLADNMINLIFNTHSSRQNESMKQLALVTILFLPMTFLTGYFGMNFARFSGVQHNSDSFFWKIATPLVFGTTIYLMRDMFRQYILKKLQRRFISRSRKAREGGIAEAKRK